MSLADLGISIEEWAHNRRIRGLPNVLTTIGHIESLSLTQRNVVELAARLGIQILQISSPADGTPKAVRVRHPNGSAYAVKAEDFEKNFALTGLAVSQIRSGNSHLLLQFRRAGSEQKPQQAALTDADPQPAEVRVATHDVDVQPLDGTIDTISGGTTFDVCRSTRAESMIIELELEVNS